MDVATILAVTCITAALQGGLIVTVWLREPDMSSLLWWSVGFFTTGVGLLLVLAGAAGAPKGISIVVATTLLIFAYGAYWQGLRSFDGEHVWAWSTLIGPVIWLIACTQSGFMESRPARLALFALIVFVYAGLCARQAWLGRHEPLPSRRLIFLLWSAVSVMFGFRVIFATELAAPPDIASSPQGLPFQFVALFNLLALNVGGLLALTLAHERRQSARLLSALVAPMREVLPRETFEARGAKLLARAYADGATASLLLIALGRPHLIGAWDDNTRSCFAMRQLGAKVPGILGEDGLVSCFGYATLACLLPHSEEAAARDMADQIRHAFLSLHGGRDKAPPRVGFRVGVACTARSGFDLLELVRAADRELRVVDAPPAELAFSHARV